MTLATAPSPEFRSLSARLGSDPLRVQGPGGNTSIKIDSVMWIKASGTELADADSEDIFVAVDRNAAVAEAHGAGDGTCKSAVIDSAIALRPSIETTFHAVLDWPVVAHTHSIATIAHAVSVEGRLAAREKLTEMPVLFVPYRKPGLPLTQEIQHHLTARHQIIVLENHGLICCGNSVSQTEELMNEVEERLQLPAQDMAATVGATAPEGYEWATEVTRLGTDQRNFEQARSGSYYPDHVVFLGSALPVSNDDPSRPACLIEGKGVLIRNDATRSQRAMLQCLADVLARLPTDWEAEAIGTAAEAELLNWDAEKYRQALAQRG